MANWQCSLVTDAPSKASVIKVGSEYACIGSLAKYAADAESKPKLNVDNVAALLQDPETYATTILTVCLIMYKDETFKVDPLVLFQWLLEDFGVHLHQDNENKLQAILTVMTTDFFYTDLDVFKSVCKTLLSGDPGIYDMGVFNDPPTVPEILWGMYEVALVSDEEVVNTFDYSPEIQRFVDWILKSDIVDDTAPDSLDSLEDEGLDLSTDVIRENAAALKAQLIAIGLAEIPRFPALEIDDGDPEGDPDKQPVVSFV